MDTSHRTPYLPPDGVGPEPVQFDPRAVLPSQFIEQAARHGIPLRTARQILSEVLGRGTVCLEALVEKQLLRKRFAATVAPLSHLQLESHLTSAVDNFQKLLFRTPSGDAIETVLIPLHKENAVSLCLSSQVGCVMGCAFCATARLPVRRSLAVWEIVDQFLQARSLVQSQGRKVTGAVFMGMGEPFLNYDRVIAAANIFRFPISGAIRGKAITISTVGVLDKIDRFTAEGWPFRLSISLGAATDEKRKKLVPIAARHPIKDIIAAAKRHAECRRDRVMLSYVCIGGENVSREDARELAELIGDTPVRLDLIDVTDATGEFRRPTEKEMRAFRDALSQYLGQPVVRRYSGGADIQAACGTLAAQ